ncbi:MAG: hypothetical protein KY452_10325 [Actinobacteria bacterium]|nr:hypothetical protein [Actinomycetota bacterium]
MILSCLPPLLRAEPALAEVVGRGAASLAVPEAARAVTLAALVERSGRRPLVVAVPTTAEAERLVSDLELFLGADAVDLFPAWETLPFERVSPSVEAMGRRLRTVWRLRTGVAQVVVAPVRALVQRLGPHVDDVEPVYRAAERWKAFDDEAFRNRLVELPGDVVQLYVRDPAGNLVEVDHHGVDRLPEDLRAELKALWDFNPQDDEHMSARLFVPE